MLDQITPLILTYNEAPNIARALSGLGWARQVVVIDSFSDDDTVEIANSFPNVRVVQRAFDCHRNQWTFGLNETEISTPWVLALDADYVLTDEFISELKTLQPNTDTAGYRARFIYCIKGKHLRSGIYPPVTVLYRRQAATYVQDGHTQRVAIEGAIGDLHSPVLHDDRKPLRRWFNSQSRYTELEAQKLLATDPAELEFADRLRRWRFIVPPAMLIYCLIIRGGILDGSAGFYYAFQRAMAELMLSHRLHESKTRI
ncbi:MAG TPA: glycosyltransferase family 2 protein [Pyrinomonadaceae bacterium]|jgi:glycosyltransferase involved in cell wall biosynthesis|nr:glycosyltransferase family 2 protein [Pyrinomonadaceae bacterium]